MAVSNATIINKVRTVGSNDFQHRVSDPTQASMAQIEGEIFGTGNLSVYNEFVNTLINLIGMQRIRTKSWDNPLAVFKGAKLTYGNMIEEMAPRWIKAHSYTDEEDGDLLGTHRGEWEIFIHRMNRQEKYPITVNRAELQMAFRDEYGLSNWITAQMDAVRSSDNYDEFNSMLQLLAIFEDRWGFYKRNLTAAPTNKETAEELLTDIREDIRNLTVPSTTYTASGFNVPVFANKRELVLITTNRTAAVLDVTTLASVFNLDKAEIEVRQISVPSLPIPDAVAILTTEDFFVCHDVLYENTSFFNSNTLNENYFLHHWSILSLSPFVPAIVYTTATGTTVPTVTQAVTSLNLATASDTVDPGETVQLTPTLNGTLTPEGVEGLDEIVPDSCTYYVTCMRTTGEGESAVTESVALNTRTYVDRFNVLHLQKTNVKAGDVITVKAISTYINPNGATSTDLTDTITLTVA